MTAEDTADRRRNQTREKLLEGALALLVDEGYSAATTGRIARAGGIKQSSFYSHFDSRDACLAEAITTEGRALAARMAARRASLPDLDVASSPESIKAGVLMVLDHLKQHPNLARVLLQLADADGAMGDAVRAVLSELRDAFVHDFRRFGVTVSDDAAIRTEMLIALIAQAEMGIRRHGHDLDTVASIIVEHVRLLFPRPPSG